ncbi:hypothetical protein C7402_10678 [Paraburkholderia unamae]|uniref:CD-NTase-associated protein 15 domain-containing protein n=1 Tax=Paraburkholderia unamae TaxID=219649 RepID=A0ABX5KT94_9BURK|nr:hypothetical protein [Paraburkholderia unamae]PVX83674.1 hypothetical protein C7402_10678 [Paraburkholderia unamae]RAR63820.1 hypothetical protein C7401_10577 [Paraburkholderia unamae]
MLHLLPLRSVMRLVFVLVALAVFLLTGAGFFANQDLVHTATLFARWSAGGATAIVLLGYAAWRWIPQIQNWIFPYLGGDWEGTLTYDSPGGKATIPIQLLVKHTLVGLRLLLESAESTSETLVVHAERNADFARYRLYYVYMNQRKEGVAGSGARYRGVSVLRLDAEKMRLDGDYFTETHRHGTLSLTYIRPTAWWKIWR